MAGKYLTRTIRTTLIAVFTFQLLSTVERQVFDFLGYMWAPIIGNFFQIIAVILGLFGACQHYRSFVVVYAVWSLLWLGWNIFVICLYLEVGILNRNRGRYILTIGTESKSWWLEHGIGCNITNTSWLGNNPKVSDTGRPIPPEEYVEGCILQYYYVEVIHAAVQVLLALVGLVVAFVIIYALLEEEDASVPANDELEFMMIRSRSSSAFINNNFHNLAFDSDTNDEEDGHFQFSYFLPPHGSRPNEPPSYDVIVRNTHTEEEMQAADQYYASAQRSGRRIRANTKSKRSATAQQRGGNQASNRSRHSKQDGDMTRAHEELPWVHIAPSASGNMC